MEFRGLFINILLVALVCLGIFGFITTLQGNYDDSAYNVTDKIASNPKVAYLNDLKANITTIYGNSNSSQSAFYSETPSVDSGGLMLTTIVSAGKILSATISVVYDILVNGVAKQIGVDSSTVIIIEAIMIGGVILLAWSLFRLGR